MVYRGKRNDVVLFRDGFSFKGRRLSDSDISNLSLTYVRTNVKRSGLFDAGSYDTITLIIYTKSGEDFKIVTQGGHAPDVLILKEKTEEKHDIISIYSALCKRTFEQRLDHYISQLEANGYFFYCDTKFYPAEKKIVQGDNAFYLSDCWLEKDGYFIAIQKSKTSITEKLKKAWDGGPGFTTTVDSDVIHFLLDKLFGLKWS